MNVKYLRVVACFHPEHEWINVASLEPELVNLFEPSFKVIMFVLQTYIYIQINSPITIHRGIFLDFLIVGWLRGKHNPALRFELRFALGRSTVN